MEASQNLRRPSNWQDFETLCKKLWGEIWQSPEIKKNGRSGQNQNGVDIYAIPLGEEGYYGIQCKGKDEYSNKQFSEDEITKEIIKAKEFKPALKKLYFVTTAVKDVVIEEFIRTKNIENKSNDLFEIHVFSWEDIVELIDENKKTHDWYLKNQNYKLKSSVVVKFENNEIETTLIPKFKKDIIYYKLKETSIVMPFMDTIRRQQFLIDSMVPYSRRTEVNLSYIHFNLTIENTGDEPIEEYKIFVDFVGEVEGLSKTNKNEIGLVALIGMQKFKTTTYLDFENKSFTIIPLKPILVGDDYVKSEEIYLKPSPNETQILLKWKLISKTFKDTGELLIKLSPDIEINRRSVFVEKDEDVRREGGEIEDYIVKENNNKF